MRFEGVIKTWNDERGFGFIEPARGDQEIFVHVKAFRPRSGRPEVGQHVTFEVELSQDGRKRARKVEPVRARQLQRRPSASGPAQWGTASYFAIGAFLALFLFVAIVWRVPGWVGGVYAAASLVAFLAAACAPALPPNRATKSPRKGARIPTRFSGSPSGRYAIGTGRRT